MACSRCPCLPSRSIERLANHFRPDMLVVPEFDQLLAQQTQRPMVAAVRSRGAGNRDQVRCLPRPHYDLHVWLWKGSPSGIFSMWNPSVSCPAHH